MTRLALVWRARLCVSALTLFTVVRLVHGGAAEALPAEFSIAMKVSAVTEQFPVPNPEPPCAGTPCNRFINRPEVGNTYFAYFTIDDDLLSQTGTNLSAALTSFVLQIESLIFDKSRPWDAPADPTIFSGFRGPGAGCENLCIGAPSPGFDVADGTIIGLHGGPFAAGDTASVNFFGTFFEARDVFFVKAFGSLAVARVHEPPTVVLVAISLASLIVVSVRGRARR